MACAVGLQDQPGLFRNNFVARDAATGHHYDECHIVVARSYHRGDHAALAVSHQSYFARIDFRTRLQVCHPGFSIGGKVSGGGQIEIACGFSDAAIIGT